MKKTTINTVFDNPWRKDFPTLHQSVHGKPLVYLDNAATAQKPQMVLDAVNQFYQQDNSNIHRGVHTLSERATEHYEATRSAVKQFIQAENTNEIIFVKGTTEAINLVAQSFVRPQLQANDEIIISAMEHHANIVPWQLVCQQTGAKLKVIPMTERGELILDEYYKLLNPRVKFISITHISNVLGTINPVKQIIAAAKQHNIPIMLDGAQSVLHDAVNVGELECDFFAFSAHKLYGPTGVGVLYGKAQHLNAMPPYQGGGDMIKSVSFAKTEYNDIPYKFEAGTPNIAGVIGLGAALNYVQSVGLDTISQHEQALLHYATEQTKKIDGLRIIGEADNKVSIISFILDDIHAHDIGTILDHQGIAVRAGHHCAMPIMDFFKVAATTRASFALYNTYQDVDIFINGLHEVKKLFNA